MGACGSSTMKEHKAAQHEAANCDHVQPQLTISISGSDKDLNKVPSVEKKYHCCDGDCIGFCCRKGLKKACKVSPPNQDAWSVCHCSNGICVFSVFDGHGDRGHEASELAKEMLPTLTARHIDKGSQDLKPALREAFRRIQNTLARRQWSELSGTTATVVIHDGANSKITVAHVGDSTAVLGRVKSSGDGSVASVKAIQLTKDHKPEVREERKRIEQNGGRVVNDGGNYRVVKRGTGLPGLNMSRSLGDNAAHRVGVVADPELGEHPLEPCDCLLLLCSDGIWEVFSPQEALDFVMEAGAMCNPKKAAELLQEEARRLWIAGTDGKLVDDITVVLAPLGLNLSSCCAGKLHRSDTSTSTMPPPSTCYSRAPSSVASTPDMQDTFLHTVSCADNVLAESLTESSADEHAKKGGA